MSLNTLTTIFTGLCGIVLAVLAIQAPSILAEMERKGTVAPEQLAKYKKFFRPGCILGALCSFGAVLLGLVQK
jgi:hypothetical protein